MDMATALAELGATEATSTRRPGTARPRRLRAAARRARRRAARRRSGPGSPNSCRRGRPGRARGPPGDRGRPARRPGQQGRDVRALLHRPAGAGLRRPRAGRLQAVLAELPGRAAGPGPPGPARRLRRPGRARRVPGLQLDLAARRLHRRQRRHPGGARLPPHRPAAREALADPAAPHPDEVRLIAPAGTVVVFNSHLWHGGTQNRSDRPRRALHSYFTRRANGQQLDQKKYIRPQTLARLSPAARFILDV